MSNLVVIGNTPLSIHHRVIYTLCVPKINFHTLDTFQFLPYLLLVIANNIFTPPTVFLSYLFGVGHLLTLVGHTAGYVYVFLSVGVVVDTLRADEGDGHTMSGLCSRIGGR